MIYISLPTAKRSPYLLTASTVGVELSALGCGSVAFLTRHDIAKHHNFPCSLNLHLHPAPKPTPITPKAHLNPLRNPLRNPIPKQNYTSNSRILIRPKPPSKSSNPIPNPQPNPNLTCAPNHQPALLPHPPPQIPSPSHPLPSNPTTPQPHNPITPQTPSLSPQAPPNPKTPHLCNIDAHETPHANLDDLFRLPKT